MAFHSLSDALELYKSYLFEQHTADAQPKFNHILRAFIYYLFRDWNGPIPEKPTLSQSIIERSWKFMESISVEELGDVVEVQERIFEEVQATKQQKQVYGFAIRQFMTWMKGQDWSPFEPDPVLYRNYAPQYNHGHGSVYSESVSGRKQQPSYALLEREIPPSLQSQLDEFYSFFTAERWPKRLDKPIKLGVAKGYVVGIRRFLGWFCRHARPIYEHGDIVGFSDDPDVPLVPIEQLCLDLLVPKLDPTIIGSREDIEHRAHQISDYIELWFCRFLDFLEIERENKSSKSLISMAAALHALIRFQYYDQTKDPEYRDIPAMEMLRGHLCDLNAKMKQQEDVSDIEMRWLDLPDIWRLVVTPLRKECSYRTVTGHLRPTTAIAHSFQLFIIWGLLTFRPPRRQHELRDLKMALSCPVERPDELHPGQVIHPLPVDRADDKYHGYLFKDKDGIWYMDMTPESYKTGKKYGHQKLRIPNDPLVDGKKFYDYLEAFLYGYYRDDKGNWISGGQATDTVNGRKGEWYSLRMELNPNHDHVFTRPRAGGHYIHSEFTKLLRTSSNRLTGQRVHPHLLRGIFATWFLDQGYTPERIASLAYGMAQSEAALRRYYDRRNAKEKNRPIEETLSQLVPEVMT